MSYRKMIAMKNSQLIEFPLCNFWGKADRDPHQKCCQQYSLNLSKEAIKTLATFAASHHGRYEWNAFFSKKRKNKYGGQNWQALQQFVAGWLMQQFGLSWKTIKVDETCLTKKWLVYAAGLCSVDGVVINLYLYILSTKTVLR